MPVGQVCYHCEAGYVTDEGLEVCPVCQGELRTVYESPMCKNCGLGDCDVCQVWVGMDETDHYDLYESNEHWGPGPCMSLHEDERRGQCAKMRARGHSKAWMAVSERLGTWPDDILDDFIFFRETLTLINWYDWELDLERLVKVGLDMGLFVYDWED